MWAQQHTIYYRPIEEEQPVVSNKSTTSSSSSSSTRKNGKSSSSKLIRKKTEFWTEGTIPSIVSPLTPFLSTNLPADVVTVQDASLDALCMLRIVNALNRHWESLYGCVRHENIVNQSEFIHSKVEKTVFPIPSNFTNRHFFISIRRLLPKRTVNSKIHWL